MGTSRTRILPVSRSDIELVSGNVPAGSTSLTILADRRAGYTYEFDGKTYNIPDSCTFLYRGYAWDKRINPTPFRDHVLSEHASRLQEMADEFAANAMNLAPLASTTFVRSSVESTMTDVVTPGFKKISSEGGIVMSPMTQDKSSFICIPDIHISEFQASYSYSAAGGDKDRSYFYIYFSHTEYEVIDVGVSEGLYSNLLGAATLGSSANLGSAVADAHTSSSAGIADLVTALAESKETIGHMNGTIRRLASLLRAIKKGKFKELAPKTFRKWKRLSKTGKAKLTLDIISDAWLEARYAWRPLVYDIQNIIDFANSPFAERRTYRGFDRDESSGVGNFTHTENGRTYEVSYTLISESTARAGLLTQLKSSAFANGRDLGLSNLAGAAWEAIPYSFVVDWFVNIGGLIAAMSPNPFVDMLGSWVTDHRKVTVIGVVQTTSSDGTEISTNFSLTREHKNRTIEPSPSIITIDVNLDVAKLIDAIALLKRWG